VYQVGINKGIVLCIISVYMCTELLPPGGYPIAVKYIISNDFIILVYIQRELLTSLRPEVHWISKIITSPPKILRARMVKWNGNPESLGATCWFVHAGPKWICVQM